MMYNIIRFQHEVRLHGYVDQDLASGHVCVWKQVR